MTTVQIDFRKPTSRADVSPAGRLLPFLVGAIVFLGVSIAGAQSVDPLVEEGVRLRLAKLELGHLLRTKQLDGPSHGERKKALDRQEREYKQRLSDLPADQQKSLREQVENRFAVIYPPIKDAWAAEAIQLRDRERALSAERTAQLEIDAQAAADLQVERVFKQRAGAEGGVSPSRRGEGDSTTIAEIEALQEKYASYGGTWAATFNKRVQTLTTSGVTKRDLEERLADSVTEVGRDAHRAAGALLAVERIAARQALGVITLAESTAESAPFQKELEGIRGAYSTGGAMAASQRDFNQRVDHLVRDGRKTAEWGREAHTEMAARPKQTGAQPGRSETTANRVVDMSYLSEMPEASRLLSEIAGRDPLDTAARQIGAFYQLRELSARLSNNEFGFRPRSPEETGLLESYLATRNRLLETTLAGFDPDETQRLGMNSPRATWVSAMTAYETDVVLEKELLDRYFSAGTQARYREILASRLRKEQEDDAAKDAQRQRWQAAEENRMRAERAKNLLVGILVAIALGLIALPVAIVVGGKSARHSSAGRPGALTLPADLRRVNLFKLQYDVECLSGLIYEKEIWTETHMSTTTSGGGAHVSGGVVHSSPVRTHVSVNSTVQHRYWLRTPQGDETWRRFSADAFQAAVGQPVSTIETGDGVLAVYNHTTGQFATRRGWYRALHKLPGGKLLILCTLAGSVTFVVLMRLLFGSDNAPGTVLAGILYGFVPVLFVTVIWSAIVIAVLKALVLRNRNREFERIYLPAFRQFLRDSTPALIKQFRTP